MTEKSEEMKKLIDKTMEYIGNHEVVEDKILKIRELIDECMNITMPYERSFTFIGLCEVSGHLETTICYLHRELEYAKHLLIESKNRIGEES